MQQCRPRQVLGTALGLLVTWSCGTKAPTPAAPQPQEAQVGAESVASTMQPLEFGRRVDAERYARVLRAIAKPRPPGSRHWRVVQTLCQESLVELGFEVELHRYTTGINVVGTLPGEAAEAVVVGAHYDHIPGCDGADDNASGVAAALELARVLSTQKHRRTLLVACWDEEERGLVGSRHWNAEPAHRERPLALYVNFDAIGFATDEPQTQTIPDGFGLLFAEEVARLGQNEHRADFIAAIVDGRARPVADVLAGAAAEFGLPVSVLEVPAMLLALPVAVDLRRSDHASFWDRSVPSMMITDTANFRSEAYHCRGVPDEAAAINYAFATKVVRAAATATAFALDAPQDGFGQ